MHSHSHSHTHTHNGIVVIKNEIMLFEATWIDLEIFMLSKVSQIKTNHIITRMWNQRNDTNELVYKAEIDSWFYKTKLWLSKGKSGDGRYKLGGWD